jgi:hypothetical protein
LVPLGYIVAFPTTEGGFSPVHQDFADDLKFLNNEIKANGAGIYLPASSVAVTSAIMGHSMGGGCSFLAAKNNSSISTMVSFAAANTSPSAVLAAAQVSVPCLVFSGTNDCVVPPSQQQDLMYDSCSSSFKTQVYITGGGHCYFADYNFNCSFGEATCLPAPAITRAEQHHVSYDFLKTWLGYYLKGSCSDAQQFQDSLFLSNRITHRQNQPISCATQIKEDRLKNTFQVYPNPALDLLTLSSGEMNIESLQLVDMMNREMNVPKERLSPKLILLDVSGLSSGIFFLLINQTLRKMFCK